MKEAYENAVAESERGNVKKDVEVKSDKARTIKEKFEKGEIIHDEESDDEQEKKANAKNDDMDVFEAGTWFYIYHSQIRKKNKINKLFSIFVTYIQSEYAYSDLKTSR